MWSLKYSTDQSTHNPWRCSGMSFVAPMKIITSSWPLVELWRTWLVPQMWCLFVQDCSTHPTWNFGFIQCPDFEADCLVSLHLPCYNWTWEDFDWCCQQCEGGAICCRYKTASKGSQTKLILEIWCDIQICLWIIKYLDVAFCCLLPAN
jgi:hypothetical protein